MIELHNGSACLSNCYNATECAHIKTREMYQFAKIIDNEWMRFLSKSHLQPSGCVLQFYRSDLVIELLCTNYLGLLYIQFF